MSVRKGERERERLEKLLCKRHENFHSNKFNRLKIELKLPKNGIPHCWMVIVCNNCQSAKKRYMIYGTVFFFSRQIPHRWIVKCLQRADGQAGVRSADRSVTGNNLRETDKLAEYMQRFDDKFQRFINFQSNRYNKIINESEFRIFFQQLHWKKLSNFQTTKKCNENFFPFLFRISNVTQSRH